MKRLDKISKMFRRFAGQRNKKSEPVGGYDKDDKELVNLFLRVALCHQKGSVELKTEAETTLLTFFNRSDFPKRMI